ncbi:MAG: helix-turn-helix domain-containing protein [Candidatus Bathyarchaeia archaeon]
MRWTKQHQQQLERLAAENRSIYEIAAIMKRSPETIADKLSAL